MLVLILSSSPEHAGEIAVRLSGIRPGTTVELAGGVESVADRLGAGPDLVVVQGDGLRRLVSWVAALRALPGAASLPILAVPLDLAEPDLRALLEADVDEVLSPPFTSAELSLRVEKALRSRRHRHPPVPHARDEAEAHRQAFLDLVPLPMMVCTIEEGRVELANQPLIDLFHLDPVRLRSYAIGQFLADPGGYPRIRGAALEEGTVSEEEVAFRRQDGSEMCTLLSARIVPSGGEQRIILVFHDITNRKRNEMALARSERRLRQIADAIPAQVYLTDAGGRITFVNRAALTFSGWPMDRLHEYDWLALVHPEDRRAVERTVREAARSRQAVDFEYRACDAEGEWRILLNRRRPLWGTGRTPSGFIGVCVDITARKRTEARFEAIAKSIQEVFWLTDPSSLKIHYVNQAYRRIWGRDPERLISGLDDWLSFIHPDDRARVQESFANLTTEGYKETYRVLRPDGTIRWIRERGWPVVGVDGRSTLVASISEDITELHDAQDGLRRAKEAAERASLAKSRFLAAASHDLRQPLNAISLLTGVMRARTRDKGLQQVGDQIQHSLDAMIALFNALLDISKFDIGAVDVGCAPISVQALLARLRTDFEPMAHQKGLDLRIRPAAVTVDSDPALLERILRNFVDNAIRHTVRGGVLVGCRLRGGRIRFDVYDTGPGIPAEDLESIFEEFAQLGNPARSRREGHGLGLAIVRRAADLLGHRLEVRSVPGSGSRFSIEVPLSGSPVRPTAASPSLRPVATTVKRTLLVIEDDPLVSSAVRMLAEELGFEVIAAVSLRDIIAKVAHLEAPPDFILADYRLPGRGNGIQVIRALRVRFGVDVPACIVTGDLDSKIAHKAEAIGAEYLHKPVRPEDLSRLLSRTGAVSFA